VPLAAVVVGFKVGVVLRVVFEVVPGFKVMVLDV